MNSDLFTLKLVQCACVVKDAVKSSFECLSVVHHTCGKHSVGVADGEMIK